MTQTIKRVAVEKMNEHCTPPPTLPRDPRELARCLESPEWRLFSGCLYQIITKGDDEEGGGERFVRPFIPNAAQRQFISRLWNRNIILKARQLGMTTLVVIMWLDHALWNANQRCGIIADSLDSAGSIFRKAKFAYSRLPDEIRERFPLQRDSASELLFAHNNSSFQVATTLRGGTINRLHISEYGRICASFPQKAAEIASGSLPAVPTDGIVIIESTSRGRGGDFYEKCIESQRNHALKKQLSRKSYRFHFYPWWQEPAYRISSDTQIVSAEDHDYFDSVEVKVAAEMGIRIRIDPDQRAWYVATRRSDCSNSESVMWQEYPSTPDEAFQVATEGNYYHNDMMALRKRGGITKVPVLDVPVNTFWDIGSSDGCAIWFHQELRGDDRFIDYEEAKNQPLSHYVKILRDRGYIYGTHYLPHDANHRRLNSDYNKSTLEMLQELMPGERFVVIPRITELITGINQVRKNLTGAYFDEVRCADGIVRIENYRKRFNSSDGTYMDGVPNKANGCSEAADALRQWAQAKEIGIDFSSGGRASESKDDYSTTYRDWRL